LRSAGTRIEATEAITSGSRGTRFARSFLRRTLADRRQESTAGASYNLAFARRLDDRGSNEASFRGALKEGTGPTREYVKKLSDGLPPHSRRDNIDYLQAAEIVTRCSELRDCRRRSKSEHGATTRANLSGCKGSSVNGLPRFRHRRRASEAGGRRGRPYTPRSNGPGPRAGLNASHGGHPISMSA